MATDTKGQRDRSGYTHRPVTKVPDWHGLVAFDLLFNNLTTGLFLVAALGDLAAPEIFTAVARVAYPVALVFLITDLVCLVLDLGDPLRFHHMLRVFKPTSPMSLGTWCLTIYSLPLTVAAALSLLAPPGADGRWLAMEWARKTAVVLGLLPALGSAAYKGVLLSTNSQPGWRDARWLGGYLTNSAVMLGCAAMLVLAIILRQESATAVLRPALELLLVLNALVLFLLLGDLRTVLSRVYAPRQLWYVGLFTLGAGTLAPLCLLLVGVSPALLLAAVLLLVLGSLAIRFVIIKIPHALTDDA
jgi:Ni/Fe-hydrogenase subunit HybB-like protein